MQQFQSIRPSLQLVVEVTLVGWTALIKSLFFLFLPPEMEARPFLEQLHYRQLFYVHTAISLVLGATRHTAALGRGQIRTAAFPRRQVFLPLKK